MFEKIFENVMKKKPLVHCITNFVTVNDCANIILACGASPIMAHDHNEAEDITAVSDALMLNMGTAEHVDAMLLAGMRSNKLGHPVILDPVGAGASPYRSAIFKSLNEDVKFTAIRGNFSELKAVAGINGESRGVDAADTDRISEENIYDIAEFAMSLSHELGAVVAVSGEIDVVADAKTAYLVRNGHPMMAKITGSGCMLGALIGAFVGANKDNALEAALAAVAEMGVAGELAYEKTEQAKGGTMTFRMYLIDCISTMTIDVLEKKANIEKVSL